MKRRDVNIKTVILFRMSLYAIIVGCFVWAAWQEDSAQSLPIYGRSSSGQPQMQWKLSPTKPKLTANNSRKTPVTSNGMTTNKPLENMTNINGAGSYSNYSTDIGALSNTSNRSYRENMHVATDVKKIRLDGYISSKSEFTHNNELVSKPSDISNAPFNDFRKDWGGGDGDEDPFEPGGDEEDPGSFVDSPIGSAWPFLLVCAGLYLFLIYRKQSSKT